MLDIKNSTYILSRQKFCFNQQKLCPVLKRALQELELAKLVITAELQRLEGMPSRATYSWEPMNNIAFPMVILASGIANGHVCMTTRTCNMVAKLQLIHVQCMLPWFTAYIFDTEYPCYDQLTPVKTRYPLTSIKQPYQVLGSLRSQVSLLSGLLLSYWFSTGW